MNLLAQILGVLVGTAASAVLFNVPRQALVWSALAGLVGWAVQTEAQALGLQGRAFGLRTHQGAAGALAGALAVSLAAEALARTRRMPALVFVVPGILPLVPGTRAYRAMLALLGDNTSVAIQEGAHALLAAGGIAVGILMGTALSRGWSGGSSNGEAPRRPRRRGTVPRTETPPRRAAVLPLWGRGPGRTR